MNRSVGIGTVVLLVATAWIGLSRISPPSQPAAIVAQAAGAVSSQERDNRAKSGTQPQNLPDGPECAGIESALQKFFLISEDQINAPGYCWGSLEGTIPQPKGWDDAATANYMIALLPDPIHTRLAISFDRFTEAIEHAGQRENFSYDSSWLPWDDSDQQYSRLKDDLASQRLNDARRDQPGVLLFRNREDNGLTCSHGERNGQYCRGLVVFVVGEAPTGGVNKSEFLNAIEWLKVLRPNWDTEPLHILGPFASGSFASLQQLLRNAGLSDSSSKLPIKIASGTVSDGNEINKFRSDFCAGKDSQSFFVTFEESTKTEERRFLRLLSLEGYKPSDAVIVSEDETVFGAVSSGTMPGMESAQPESSSCTGNLVTDNDQLPVLHLNYPRDIASLRSAYQEQGLLSVDRTGGSYESRQKLLSQDLGQPINRGGDTIKVYSASQADLSDEAELLQIVQQLKQHRTRYVLLVSTNPLDQIFLAHFFRNTYPAGRIVILGSDNLLFRERGQGDLRGVLSLSPYPLSPDAQRWTSHFDGYPETFTAYSSEGVFFAADFLMASMRAEHADSHAMSGYGGPFWFPNQDIPPTWLSVISAGEPWPVAVLDENSLASTPKARWICDRFNPPGPPSVLLESRKDLRAKLRDCNEEKQTGESQPLKLPMAFQLAVVACLLWSLYHGGLRYWASLISGPRCRAYFVITAAPQHALLISFGWACVGATAVTLLRFSWHSKRIVGWHYWWWGGTLILLGLSSMLFPILDRFVLKRDDFRKGSGWAAATFFPAVIVPAYLLVLVFFIPLGDRDLATAIPEQWRALNLLSGVSPPVPFVLLAVGAYMWCFQGLHGLALFNRDQPVLPSNLDVALGPEQCHPPCGVFSRRDRRNVLAMFTDDHYREVLDRWAFPFTGPVVAIGVVAFLILLILSFSLSLNIASLGSFWYGEIYGLTVLVFVGAMAAESWQLWKLWRCLHELLIFLDRLPLRRTLRAMRDISWDSLWGLSGAVLSARYQMIARQIEVFRKLQSHCTDRAFAHEHISRRHEIDAATKSLDDELRCSFAPWFANCYKPGDQNLNLRPAADMQSCIAVLSGNLFLHVLLRAWALDPPSIIAIATLSSRPDADPARALPSSPLVQAAEEFVCLNYLSFIQNCMGRIRTLITGMACVFLAAAFSSAVYPFDPQPMFGTFFVLLFAGLAASVTVLYAQAHRDATLSNITNTDPGKLGGDFYLKVLQFAAGPALGLISVLVPSVSNFLFTWLQPGQMK